MASYTSKSLLTRTLLLLALPFLPASALPSSSAGAAPAGVDRPSGLFARARVHHPRQATTTTTAPECRLTTETDYFHACEDVLTQFNLTLAAFVALNADKLEFDCYGFRGGESYCVDVAKPVAVSTDGTCGEQSVAAGEYKSCVGSGFGDCCSAGGWCGSSSGHCAIGNCQDGNCPGRGYTTDGRCGPTNFDKRCGGSYGNCCSLAGWCGTGPSYCGAGNCQAGSCDAGVLPPTTTTTVAAATGTTTTAAPVATGSVLTVDGTCGYTNGYTCAGSEYGECCSEAGWCGGSYYHCSDLLRCQVGFGSCSRTVFA